MAQLQVVVMKNVAIVLAFAAIVVFFGTILPEDNSYCANSGTLDGQTVPKAAWLTVVSSKTCPPCKRLKPVIKRLNKEGYTCVIIDFNKYPGPERISSVPTLLYFDQEGNLLDREVGYRTYEYLKSRLLKASKVS